MLASCIAIELFSDQGSLPPPTKVWANGTALVRLKATIESDEMHRSGHADFLAWHQASLILRTLRLWEQPLPAPRHGRIGLFPSEGLRCGGAARRGQPGHPIKISRADSPWLAISCAMVWIVLGAWDLHLALLLCADHWP